MNSVNLIGRLTSAVELRYTPSQKAVASFTLAVDRIGSDDADFIPCIAWNGTAENMEKFLDKGSMVAVEGRIQVRSWDKDGTRHWKTEVVANRVKFLDRKKNATQETPSQDFVDLGTVDDGELPF